MKDKSVSFEKVRIGREPQGIVSIIETNRTIKNIRLLPACCIRYYAKRTAFSNNLTGRVAILQRGLSPKIVKSLVYGVPLSSLLAMAKQEGWKDTEFINFIAELVERGMIA
ncbi:MAG: hypothetical protein AB1393_08210 [Candidatus Edwardsbacteria bacterium]